MYLITGLIRYIFFVCPCSLCSTSLKISFTESPTSCVQCLQALIVVFPHVPLSSSCMLIHWNTSFNKELSLFVELRQLNCLTLSHCFLHGISTIHLFNIRKKKTCNPHIVYALSIFQCHTEMYMCFTTGAIIVSIFMLQM